VMPAVLSLMYRYTGRTQAPAAIGAAE